MSQIKRANEKANQSKSLKLRWMSQTPATIVTRPLSSRIFCNFQSGSSGSYGGQFESKSNNLASWYIYIYPTLLFRSFSSHLWSIFCILYSALFALTYSQKHPLTNIVHHCALCIVHCALCIVHCAKCYHFRTSITCKLRCHNNW